MCTANPLRDTWWRCSALLSGDPPQGAVDRKAMISGRPKQPTGFHRFPADSGGLRHLKNPRNTECWVCEIENRME